jgi:hypothetical protein
MIEDQMKQKKHNKKETNEKKEEKFEIITDKHVRELINSSFYSNNNKNNKIPLFYFNF